MGKSGFAWFGYGNNKSFLSKNEDVQKAVRNFIYFLQVVMTDLEKL